MKVIYLSALCSKKEYEKMFNTYGTTSSHASQKFHRSMVQGLTENGINVAALSYRAISRPLENDLVKEAEPAEIHFLVGCPPVIAPCYYGVAMATKKELIAANYSVEEIQKQLDIDSLGYITLPALVKAIGMDKEKLCLGCLNEDYPTEIPEGLEAETYYKP
jgi:hypothetical protein